MQSTKFTLPDGRDFSSVFVEGVSATDTGYIVPEGVDLSALFAPGLSMLETGYHDTEGNDLGYRFRKTEDVDIVAYDAKEEADDKVYYNFNVVSGKCDVTGFSKNGELYKRREEIMYPAMCAYCVGEMKKGRQPVASIKWGRGDELKDHNELWCEITEQPTTANGYNMKFWIWERWKWVYPYRFQVVFNFP